LLQEKLQNRVSIIGVIVFDLDAAGAGELLHKHTSRRGAMGETPREREGGRAAADCGLAGAAGLRLRQHMVREHAAPQGGRRLRQPDGFSDLVWVEFYYAKLEGVKWNKKRIR
jgi:hypothetical protein